MTQELIDLRSSILEGRYADALAIVDELEGMSRQAILRNIESFLLRLMVHLIKNQIKQKLTNSWAACISDSLRQIQKLNLKDTKTSYYIQSGEWLPYLEETIEAAIDAASIEVCQGIYTPFQLAEMVNRSQLILAAEPLLMLTYEHSARVLPAVVKEYLVALPGGKAWKEGK